MGRCDDPAFIRKVKEVSGAEKVYYIGYSQGSIQMFYGLSHLEEEFYADNLHMFIAFAPCTIYNVGETPESFYESTIYKLPDIGVYSLYGPNWESDYEKVCT